MTLLEQKKETWIQIWKELFRSHKINRNGLGLDSPHQIIQELIVEVQQNHLSNSENRHYFDRKIHQILSDDPIIAKHQLINFKNLSKNIREVQTGIINTICSEIITFFQSETYFNLNLDLLVDTILGEENLTWSIFQKMRNTSSTIINEFLIKGYVLDDIKMFTDYIFDDYQILNNKWVRTDYPGLDTAFNLIDLNSDEGKNHQKELKDYFNNLTVKERIMSLGILFRRTSFDVTFITTIIGLKETDYKQFSELIFYRPGEYNFLSSSPSSAFNEDLQASYGNCKFVQVAINTKFTSPKSTMFNAVERIREILNILTTSIIIKTPLVVDTSSWLIVDKQGKMIHYSKGSDSELNRLTRYYESYNLDRNFNEINKIIFERSNADKNFFEIPLDARILSAMHWQRKGHEAVTDAHKLLFYWISIECIFEYNNNIEVANKLGLNENKMTKFDAIRCVLVSCNFRTEIHDMFWHLYWDYEFKTMYFPAKSMILPDDLLVRSTLNPSASGYRNIKQFANTLNEIKNYEKSKMLLKRIKELQKFYTDSKYNAKIFKKIILNLSDDVLMIYRNRNLIVHNAPYKSPMMPIYAGRAKAFSEVLLNSILKGLKDNDNLLDILVKIKQNKDQYVTNLENGVVDIFSDHI